MTTNIKHLTQWKGCFHQIWLLDKSSDAWSVITFQLGYICYNSSYTLGLVNTFFIQDVFVKPKTSLLPALLNTHTMLQVPIVKHEYVNDFSPWVTSLFNTPNCPIWISISFAFCICDSSVSTYSFPLFFSWCRFHLMLLCVHSSDVTMATDK